MNPQSHVPAVFNPMRVQTPDHILDGFGRRTVGWLDNRLTVRPVHFIGFPEGPPAWLQTPAASRLLARGAKFIPTPRVTDACDIGQAFDAFARSTHLRLYFGDSPMDKHTRQFRIPNPGWQLPRHVRDSVEHRNLAAHLALLRQRLLSTYERAFEFASTSRKFRRNLTMSEMRVMRSLRSSHELVIKPADKNLGLCVMTIDWYVAEGTRQMRAGNYEQTCDFSMAAMLSKWDHFLAAHGESINYAETKWLRHQRATGRFRLAVFYMLPKLHKTPLTGRPIVASRAWVFTPLSQWLAYHLNKVLETCDTVLASTASIVTKLRSFAHPLDGDVYLVTADASDMYNNIPVDQAILAVGALLLRRNQPQRLVAAVTAGLELVLKNNFFTFNGSTYRQTAGIAMGTPCAPPLAQLFVAGLEEALRASLGQQWPALYVRYIDDGFAVFKGRRDRLDTFLAAIQAMHPNLRWTFNVSQKAVAFLDLTIWLGRDGRLGHSVHTKALNAFQYIPPFSFHAPAVARGWILTELFRIRRNSSTELARLYACLKFFKRLRKRGYRQDFLSSVFAFEVARQGQAHIARCSRQYMVLPFDRTASVWPYRSVIQEWYESVPCALVGAAPGVAFKRSATLGSRIVRAQLPPGAALLNSDDDIEIVLSDAEDDV
jgi:hypothetical protein